MGSPCEFWKTGADLCFRGAVRKAQRSQKNWANHAVVGEYRDGDPFVVSVRLGAHEVEQNPVVQEGNVLPEKRAAVRGLVKKL